MSEKTGTGDCTRRQFFTHVSITLGSIAAVLVGIPIVGSILAPIIDKSKPDWRPVGALDSFKVGGGFVKVDYVDSSPLPWAGVTANSAAWLKRESGDKFIAFSVNCAHLGCPVRWISGAKLFMCPCHGGVYYEDGSVAAGPPPRGLYQYPVRVRDGQVEILASPIPITTV
jgi:quinol---cytochrome c reductase iron-sulfur subunit, bacillus type